MRTALVMLHALPGLVGLAAGFLSLRPPQADDGRRVWRLVYGACVAILIAGLVVLLAYDWGDLDATARVAFTGLAGLAAVMGYRLHRARREAADRTADWQGRYVAHVYFTYVSLWVGFLVVPALAMPMPQVAVPLAVVAVVATGGVLVGRYRRRLGV